MKTFNKEEREEIAKVFGWNPYEVEPRITDDGQFDAIYLGPTQNRGAVNVAARRAIAEVPTTTAGAVGALGAMAAIPAIMSGPPGWLLMGGALAGGLGAAALAELTPVPGMARDFFIGDELQQARDFGEHPVASVAGEVASAAPVFQSAALRNLGSALSKTTKAATFMRGQPLYSQAERAALMEAGANISMGGGIETARMLLDENSDFDLGRLAMASLGNAAYGAPRFKLPFKIDAANAPLKEEHKQAVMDILNRTDLETPAVSEVPASTPVMEGQADNILPNMARDADAAKTADPVSNPSGKEVKTRFTEEEVSTIVDRRAEEMRIAKIDPEIARIQERLGRGEITQDLANALSEDLYRRAHGRFSRSALHALQNNADPVVVNRSKKDIPEDLNLKAVSRKLTTEELKEFAESKSPVKYLKSILGDSPALEIRDGQFVLFDVPNPADVPSRPVMDTPYLDRRGIPVVMDTDIRTPDGESALGSYQDGVVRLDPTQARPDTEYHEGIHAEWDFLMRSQDPKDQDLVQKFKAVARGATLKDLDVAWQQELMGLHEPGEFMDELVAVAATHVKNKRDKEGMFQRWAKDNWSALRTRFSTPTPEDLGRVMSQLFDSTPADLYPIKPKFHIPEELFAKFPFGLTPNEEGYMTKQDLKDVVPEEILNKIDGDSASVNQLITAYSVGPERYSRTFFINSVTREFLRNPEPFGVKPDKDGMFDLARLHSKMRNSTSVFEYASLPDKGKMSAEEVIRNLQESTPQIEVLDDKRNIDNINLQFETSGYGEAVLKMPGLGTEGGWLHYDKDTLGWVRFIEDGDKLVAFELQSNFAQNEPHLNPTMAKNVWAQLLKVSARAARLRGKDKLFIPDAYSQAAIQGHPSEALYDAAVNLSMTSMQKYPAFNELFDVISTRTGIASHDSLRNFLEMFFIFRDTKNLELLDSLSKEVDANNFFALGNKLFNRNAHDVESDKLIVSDEKATSWQHTASAAITRGEVVFDEAGKAYHNNVSEKTAKVNFVTGKSTSSNYSSVIKIENDFGPFVELFELTPFGPTAKYLTKDKIVTSYPLLVPDAIPFDPYSAAGMKKHEERLMATAKKLFGNEGIPGNSLPLTHDMEYKQGDITGKTYDISNFDPEGPTQMLGTRYQRTGAKGWEKPKVQPDGTIPMSVFNAANRINPKLGAKLMAFASENRRLQGHANEFILKAESADLNVLSKAWEKRMQAYETGQNPSYTSEEIKLIKDIVDPFYGMTMREHNAVPDSTKIKPQKNYVSHMWDIDWLEKLKKMPADAKKAEVDRALQSYLNYNRQFTKSRGQFEVKEATDHFHNVINTMLKGGDTTGDFNALSKKARLYGIPEEFRDNDAISVLRRYGNRWSTDVARRRWVDKDSMKELKSPYVDRQLADLILGHIHGKKQFSGSGTATAFQSLLYRGIMQLPTGVFNFLNSIGRHLTLDKPGDIAHVVKGYYKGLTEFSDMLKRGQRMGGISTSSSRMLYGDLFAWHGTFAKKLADYGELVGKFTLSNFAERGGRAFDFSIGRSLAEGKFHDPEFRRKYGHGLRDDMTHSDQLDMMANNYMISNQTSYGPEDLPAWMLSGNKRAFFLRLQRFGVAHALRTYERTIVPAMNGNFTPLLSYLAGGLLVAGPLTDSAREAVRGYDPTPTDEEIMALAEDPGFQRVLNVMEAAEAASLYGIVGMIAGTFAVDARGGMRPAYSEPVVDLMLSLALNSARVFDSVKDKGEDPVMAMVEMAERTIATKIQMLYPFLGDRDEKKDARDKRVFSYLSDQERPSITQTGQAMMGLRQHTNQRGIRPSHDALQSDDPQVRQQARELILENLGPDGYADLRRADNYRGGYEDPAKQFQFEMFLLQTQGAEALEQYRRRKMDHRSKVWQ
jgi:hypothetical protein